jgi:hypothetical protein
MIYGIAYLAGRDKKEILANHPEGAAAQFFWKVLDEKDEKIVWDNEDLIKQFAERKLAPLIAVQMRWRDDHKFDVSKLISYLKKECPKLLKIVEANPSIDWNISIACEHELNERDWTKANDEAVKVFTNKVTYVNSPNVRKGFVSKKYLNEYHGAEQKPRSSYIHGFSFDGTNAVDSDVELYRKNYSKGKYFFFWVSQCNGNRKLTLDPKEKKPRAQRIYYLVGNQIKSLWALRLPKGKTKFPKNRIGKSHADQANMPPSGKDQKPVYLIELSARTAPRRIHLKLPNGTTVVTSSERADWSDERTKRKIGYRYYFPKWGFEISQKVNNAVLDIFEDGEKVGTWNIAFRDGKYR